MTGHAISRFAVVLSCLANGSKLSPVIIYKTMNHPKFVKFPSSAFVQDYPKGWMDEDEIEDWLEKV